LMYSTLSVWNQMSPETSTVPTVEDFSSWGCRGSLRRSTSTVCLTSVISSSIPASVTPRVASSAENSLARFFRDSTSTSEG